MEDTPLQQVDRTRVVYEGRRLVYFGGCDYLRFASHPAILDACRQGLARFGLNVAASRLTTGEHQLYRDLESELAAWFGARTATLFSSGYCSNLGLAQALVGEFTHALIDIRSHSSLKEAAQLLQCPVHTFRHQDPNDLSRLVHHIRPQRPVVITDGLFAHNGSVAPLRAYLAVLPSQAWMIVDDSHGAAIIGRTGKGTLEQEGVPRARIIQTITLSKAFGVYGGAVLGDAALRRRILRQSSIFAGNTPLPLPLAYAALRSIRLLKRNPRPRLRLQRNARHAKTLLRQNGWPLPDHPGPIISLVPIKRPDIRKLRNELLAAGIHPPFIRYPGGPADGHFRFAISSEHTLKELSLLSRLLSPFAPRSPRTTDDT